jgi:Fe-S oxidoreductase/nitrate reductase gamma subunit
VTRRPRPSQARAALDLRYTAGMLATRDPYLFVPGWLPLLLAILLAAFLFFRATRHLYRLMMLGAPELRTDHPGERWQTFLRHVLGQGRLLADSYSGWMHALIFWGFIIITIGTVEMLGKGLWQGFFIPLLEHNPAFLLLLDIFQLLVLVGVGMALYRRLVWQPLRLSYTADALIILALIGGLMLTDFLADGFAIAVERNLWDIWSPVGSVLASLFAPLGQERNLALHKILWWSHAAILLAFLAYLPRSKHLHIVTAPFNVWLRSSRPRGQLSYIDIEKSLDEDRPIGASEINHFSWKHLLDLYTCTECGRCEAACPASRTGKPLSPKKLVLDLKDYLLERGPRLLSDDEAVKGTGGSKVNGAGSSVLPDHAPMVGGVIADEVLWDCTTCRACMQVCPVFIEHVPKIIDMRRHLAMVESRFGQGLQRLFDNLETSGNPWRFPRSTRADWASELSIKTMAEAGDGEVDYLYWVGCAGAHDERNVKVARSLSRLMQRAGVKFSILGTEETCSGDPARRAGNEYLYQMLAQQNVETLNRHGVKKIVASCPHCFNTLKSEYPQLGGNFEVIHHSQLLAELVAGGKLEPKQRIEQAVAYHDPCYIGRYHDIYDRPRELLGSVPGVELREIPSGCRESAMCCGAGGARAFLEERRGKRINHLRVEQALEAQPKTLATGCPYCLMMLEDGARAKGVYETMPVSDVAELLEQSLGLEGTASSQEVRA